jgi:hypothetical protein
MPVMDWSGAVRRAFHSVKTMAATNAPIRLAGNESSAEVGGHQAGNARRRLDVLRAGIEQLATERGTEHQRCASHRGGASARQEKRDEDGADGRRRAGLARNGDVDEVGSEDPTRQHEPTEPANRRQEGMHEVPVAARGIHQGRKAHRGADRRHHGRHHAGGEGVGDHERGAGQDGHRQPGAEQHEADVDLLDHEQDGGNDDEAGEDQHGRLGGMVRPDGMRRGGRRGCGSK